MDQTLLGKYMKNRTLSQIPESVVMNKARFIKRSKSQSTVELKEKKRRNKSHSLIDATQKLLFMFHTNDEKKLCSFKARKTIIDYAKIAQKHPDVTKDLSKKIFKAKKKYNFNWKNEIKSTIDRIKEKQNLQGIYLKDTVTKEICKSTGKAKHELQEEDLLRYYSFSQTNALRAMNHFNTVDSVSSRNMNEKRKLMKRHSYTLQLPNRLKKRMAQLSETRFKYL